MSIENSDDGINAMKGTDLHSTLSVLIAESRRTQAALDIILRELAGMKAKNNDLMGDGQKLNAEEIYKRFRQEIDQNV